MGWFIGFVIVVLIAEVIVILMQRKHIVEIEGLLELARTDFDTAQKALEEANAKLAAATEDKLGDVEEAVKKAEEELKELEHKKAAAEAKKDIVQDCLNQLQVALDQVSAGLEEQKEQRRLQAKKEIEEIAVDFNEKAEAYRTELSTILNELNDYRARRDALNAEIQREKAAREDTAFHRIQVGSDDAADIAVLLGLVDRLKNKDILYKLIWTSYLQKPFNQMVKNVLGHREPRNVIYEIKNEETGEIYIGKTKAEVSKRWVEHMKTSLFIGAGKPSKIHEALFNHWGDFSFAVLEEVAPTLDLSAREKYWIDFFQSNVYGYNIKAGG